MEDLAAELPQDTSAADALARDIDAIFGSAIHLTFYEALVH
jgi:hypothetical protein